MSDGDAETLAAIRARADRATPGPWTSGGDYSGPYIDGDPEPNYWRCWEWDERLQDVKGLAIVDTVTEADAEFIAHARSDIPWLLARVGQLEAENAELKIALNSAVESSIEARNPGIDMDDVRRIRSGGVGK